MQKLTKRGSTYYVVKHVPARFADIEMRKQVWISLRTDSEAEARKRSVDAVRSLEAEWVAKAICKEPTPARYDALSALAAARGFSYMPAANLAEAPVDEITRRALSLRDSEDAAEEAVVAAVLGGDPTPKLMLSESAAAYIQLHEADARDKGRHQRRIWENTLHRSMGRLVEVAGDKPVDELKREDTLAFRAMWSLRIQSEGLSPASANREIAAVGGVLSTLHKLQGIGDPNVFKGIRFSAKRGVRPPYEVRFIATRVLPALQLGGLNPEASAILAVLINTGMRPSEVVGLNAAAIRLKHAVPHISVAPRPGREIKTQTSIRDMPLVGIALEAMQAFPEGFERYWDKEPTLSATINKFLKVNDLKPEPGHCLYSFRHSFQDRLIAVEAPDRMQADLMGHRYVRERYGKGPSLEQKASWLERVAVAAT